MAKIVIEPSSEVDNTIIKLANTNATDDRVLPIRDKLKLAIRKDLQVAFELGVTIGRDH